MRRKWWRHIRPCQDMHTWYVISVSVHQIHFESVFTLETRTGTPDGLLFVWLSKHNPSCGAATQSNTRTKSNSVTCGRLYLICICQQRLGTVKNGNHCLFSRWCPCGVLLYKCMAIFTQFKDQSNFWKIWLRHWTVKISLTILLGLTSASFQWFSAKNQKGTTIGGEDDEQFFRCLLQFVMNSSLV